MLQCLFFKSGTHVLKSLLRDRHQPDPEVANSSPSEHNPHIVSTKDPPQPLLPCVSSSGLLDWSVSHIRARGVGELKKPTGGATPVCELPALDDTQLWWKTATHKCGEGVHVRDVKLSSRMLEAFPTG